MANLRVNKITGTEFFETTGSVQFDGTTDFLTISSNTDFAMGTGDFTAECWIYLRGYSDAEGAFSERVFDSNTGQLGIYITSDGTGYVGALVGGTDIRSSTAPDLQSWSHLAISRSGTTFRIFLNGTQILSRENSSSVASSGNFLIGARASGEGGFRGHISNFRILKGTALYTKNFTPPTRELTVIPNTVLLCCQSTTRANEERTGKTITVNGNAVANELTPGLLTDRIKSGGSSAISGSVGFAGTSYLSIADHPDFDFSNKSFTVEGWFNLDKGKNLQEVWFLGQLNSNGNPANGTLASITVRKFSPSEAGAGSQLAGDFYSTTSGSTSIQAKSGAGTTITEKTDWSHFAFVRDTDNIRMYVNGIGGTSVSVAGQSARSATGNFAIGRAGDFPNNTYNGFLSNIRVVVGTAVYKDNFIPPTRELKKIPGTVLLCCQDSTNPLQEATGKTISLNGSVTSYSVGIGTTTPNPSNFTPQVGSDNSIVFDGVTKINSPNYFYLPTGNTEDRGRGRGVFGGGETPNTNTIDYVNIQSTGNAIDFGDLISSTTTHMTAGCSSSTRGLFGGGRTPTLINNIDYITIATTSNALDFGDLLTPTLFAAGLSNSTRGIFAGGQTPTATNTIQYVTIASIGNAIDFGDLTISNASPSGCSSSTRGIIGGGAVPGGARTNTIEYVTISSIGNAIDFGDLTVARSNSGCSSSATRGVFGGGYVVPTRTNIIDYITIASTGNAITFGNLTRINDELSSCSNSNRAVFAGGGPSTRTNTIDYVTIASTGNAQDFGDLTVARSGTGGCSDSHGGLG